MTEPARSTCAITQPPKMSPLPLVSAGMGMTLSTNSLSLGGAAGASGWTLEFRDVGTTSPLAGPSPFVPDAPPRRSRRPLASRFLRTRRAPARLGDAAPPAALPVAVQVARRR